MQLVRRRNKVHLEEYPADLGKAAEQCLRIKSRFFFYSRLLGQEKKKGCSVLEQDKQPQASWEPAKAHGSINRDEVDVC